MRNQRLKSIWRKFSSDHSCIHASMRSGEMAAYRKRSKNAIKQALIFTATILLLASTCFAQVQGNRPGVIDSALDGSEIIGGVQGVIPWPENIVSGQTVVLCFNTQPGSSFTLADNLTVASWTTTSPTNTGGSGTTTDVWMAYKTFASSGPMTVTLTRTSGTGFYYMMGARAQGIGSVDGVVATANTGPPVTVGTINTSTTTTANNDVIFSCSGGDTFGGHVDTPGGNSSTTATEMLGSEGAASPSIGSLMTVLNAGAIGTYTPTHNTWGSGSNRAMQSLAFKVSTIQITDTGALPDAGSGVSYSAQLHCNGGTAGQTYSLFGGSLPTGITLNTSTGVISGSSTAIGSYSPQFKCTDGTVTSAAATLSLKVGGTLNVPNIRQLNNTWTGDNGGGSFVMNVQCGSSIAVFARGADTHGTAGFIQATSGVNNYIKDSFNSPVRRVTGFIPGNVGWPLVLYIIGPVTQSGADTISIANNQSSSSARTVSLATEVTGAYADELTSAFSTMTTSASGSFATNYTTVVGNTLLIAVGDSAFTLSLNSPFNAISNGGDASGTTIYGSTVVASPSSTTATVNFSGFSGNNLQSEVMIAPFRPALPLVGCPSNFGTGEKFRRQIW